MIRISFLAVLLSAILAACASSAGTTTTSPPALSSTTTISDPTTSSTTTTSTSTASSSTTSTVDTEDEMTAFEIEVVSGEVTEGGRLQAELGSVVRLVVEADVSDEVHVHGYDLFAEVTPGMPATIEFTADIPGVFEVELEDAGLELAQLVVGP